MYIIVGLGNPGKEYANTKHNVGFMTVDSLADEHDIKINKLKFKALVGDGTIAGQKVLLVKPQTYMNASGDAIREIMAFYKEPTDHLIVAYDDIDLDLGDLRLRASGSAGTHNGMRSIVQQLGSDQFPRVRIGLGGKDVHGEELISFVIGGFSKEQREAVDSTVKKAADAICCIIECGIDKAMNRFNVKPRRKKKEAEQTENISQ